MDKPRLLDHVRSAIRVRHYSYRTEQTYVQWILRYIRFHKVRHPGEMSAAEVGAFLSPSGTASRLICWQTVTISAQCRNSWGIQM